MKIKSSRNQYEMQDPTKQYPHPEFPEQEQRPPGLAQAMDPKLDHGEESYQGFGRLRGRKALITGADSGIGRAAVIAFAREGADIALNYLPNERPDAKEVIALVQEAGRKAAVFPGDIRDEAFCAKLVEQARAALGGLDILVNVAGHQEARESIADITTEQFDETFKTNVYAMFWLCKLQATRRGAEREHRACIFDIILAIHGPPCRPSSESQDVEILCCHDEGLDANKLARAPGYPGSP